jgi:rhodanese-related sulfurtransferase
MSEFKENQLIETITPQDAFKLIEKHKNDFNFIILDVRPQEEFEKEHLPGAKNLDYNGHEFKKKVGKLDRGKNYLIYCKTGVRGGYFLDIMKDSGFKQAHNILGGFVGWKINKLPLETSADNGGIE